MFRIVGGKCSGRPLGHPPVRPLDPVDIVTRAGLFRYTPGKEFTGQSMERRGRCLRSGENKSSKNDENVWPIFHVPDFVRFRDTTPRSVEMVPGAVPFLVRQRKDRIDIDRNVL